MFFVTHHGTFLCVDFYQRVIHRYPSEIQSFTELLDVDIAPAAEGERFHRQMCNNNDTPAVVIQSGPLRGCIVHVLHGGRTVAFSDTGRFFSAIPGMAELNKDREAVEGWETFACIDKQSALDLIHVLKNDWIVGSTRTIVPASEVSLDDGFKLRFGVTVIDVRYNLPFLEITRGTATAEMGDVLTSLPILAAIVLLDGWRAERIYLYKPFIFLTVFNSNEYFLQATLSLSSMLEFGHYKGRLHVISDHSKQEFLNAVPALASVEFDCQTVAAKDWVGYVASKYLVLEQPAVQNYQPLLFLDPDIMADTDINPMLVEIAVSPRPMAPMEDFSPLSQNPSVGSTLIQQYGGAPRYASGFNGGTLGLPNIRAHGQWLRMIRMIVANRIEIIGRTEFQWVDQEIANYVSFAAGNFDTTTLLRFVRFGWEGCEYEATKRIGIVHFFPPRGPIYKSEAMAAYTKTLRTADGTQDAEHAEFVKAA